MSDKQHYCPYCGDEIFIHISENCGKEPKGYTSINHYCKSGLSIEYFEHGQDRKRAEKALSNILYSEYNILEIKTVLIRLIGDNIRCPKCNESFIPDGLLTKDAIRILRENPILNSKNK